MQRFSQWLLAAVCATLVLAGCAGKQGDPGPSLTGSIVGYVNPTDENGAALAKNGVVVSIDGSSPAVAATTGTDGRFELPNVRTGTYNLTYSRSGLGTYRRYGVGHVGGDQPTYLGAVSLSQPSTILVTGLGATSNPTLGTVTLTVSLSSPTPTNTFRLALYGSSTSTVNSSTGTPLTFISLNTPSGTLTSYSTSITLQRTTFTNAGFPSGSQVYLAAYGSTAVLTGYSDPTTGRTVYPALNPTVSPTATVTVP